MSGQSALLDGVAGEAWAARWGVPSVQIHYEIGSTNDELRKEPWVTPPGAVVIALTQRAGRGRESHSWSSAPGGLYLSMLLAPREAYAPLPLCVGDMVAQAIEEVAGVAVAVKWPNDLYIGDRKLGGILCESVQRSTETRVVVGIGINVRNPIPQVLANRATSLLEESGYGTSTAELAGAIVSRLKDWTPPTDGLLETSTLSRIERRDFLKGRRLNAAVGARRVEGVALGITREGLLLVNVNGRMEQWAAASIESFGPAPSGA